MCTEMLSKSYNEHFETIKAKKKIIGVAALRSEKSCLAMPLFYVDW